MIEFHFVVVVEMDYHLKNFFESVFALPYKWRGFTPHSEIIVGDSKNHLVFCDTFFKFSAMK